MKGIPHLIGIIFCVGLILVVSFEKLPFESSPTLYPLRQLASEVFGPILSPNAKSVIFLKKDGIWVMDVDEGVKWHMPIQNKIMWYTWSSDSRKVAIVEEVGEGRKQAKLVNAKLVDVEAKQVVFCKLFELKREEGIYWREDQFTIAPISPLRIPIQPWVRRIEERLSHKSQPFHPPWQRVKRWRIKCWSPNEKVLLLEERLHPLYEVFGYYFGFLDDKGELTQIKPLSPLKGIGAAYLVCWYPDSQRMLIALRSEASAIAPPNVPKVRDYLYLVSIDGNCQEIKKKQSGLIDRVWLLEAETHLYLYLISNERQVTDNELWVGQLKGIK